MLPIRGGTLIRGGMQQCCQTVTTNHAFFLRTKGLFKILVNLNTEEYRLDIVNIKVEVFHLHFAVIDTRTDTQTRLSTVTHAHALRINYTYFSPWLSLHNAIYGIAVCYTV